MDETAKVAQNTDSMRARNWSEFYWRVRNHIAEYAVPQYGDYPNDQLTNFSLDDIKTNMMRYINRMGRNARGKEEALRDMLKVAHYASVAYEMIDHAEEAAAN